MAWPGFEPTTSRSEVGHANHYTIEASYKKGQIFHDESYNVLLFERVKIKMHVSYNEWSLVLITLLVLSLQGVIQQLHGQNFAIFWPPLSPLRGQFLYPERGQKYTFFDPLPPNLVHIVIECPLTWGKYFGPSRGESTKTSPLPSPLIEIVAQKAGYE